MSANSPVIHRPIPRRPFAVNPVTPPTEDDQKTEAKQTPKEPAGIAKFLNSRPSFLDTDASPTPGGGESISRAQSIMNLTSSTLFGIFSPSVSSRPSAVFEPSTPYGTGVETPARDLLDRRSIRISEQGEDEVVVQGTTASAAEIDEVRKASQSLMMLQRQRRRGESMGAGGDGMSSIKFNAANAVPPGDAAAALGTSETPSALAQITRLVSVLVRAALLFSLGMGYGMLMARLRSETHASFEDFVASTPPPSTGTGTEYDAIYDWRYLVSWGLSGVVLGTLLPWFDGVWDRAFAGNDNLLGLKARTAPEVHWDLVVRGIGAFAGVVFAMRKLPWASTMQASVTLALVNPFLWYLLDRSKSGLLLAAAVGSLGSATLVTLDLDLMPNPGGAGSYQVGYGMGASSYNRSSRDPTGPSATNGLDPQSPGVSVETAIWMLSVLFCSCICFGNIGRRLALSTAPATLKK